MQTKHIKITFSILLLTVILLSIPLTTTAQPTENNDNSIQFPTPDEEYADKFTLPDTNGEQTTEIQIEIQNNGDATVSIIQSFELSSSDDEDELFEKFKAEYNQNPEKQDKVEQKIQQFKQSTNNPENITNPETNAYKISALDLEEDQELDVEILTENFLHEGVIEYTFQWENFAQDDGNGGLKVTEQLQKPIHTDDNTTIIITHPEHLDDGIIQPEPRLTLTNNIEWEEGTNFTTEQPIIHLINEENNNLGETDIDFTHDIAITILVIASGSLILIIAYFPLQYKIYQNKQKQETEEEK